MFFSVMMGITLVIAGNNNKKLEENLRLLICSLSTRLDSAQTNPGFLDIKMKSKIVEDPKNTVGVIGQPSQFSCMVMTETSIDALYDLI